MIIYHAGDRVTTIHGDRGTVQGFLTPKSEPGFRTAAIRLDAGYNIAQSETCLRPYAAEGIFESLSETEMRRLRKMLASATIHTAKLAYFAAASTELYNPVQDTLEDLAGLHTELCNY